MLFIWLGGSSSILLPSHQTKVDTFFPLFGGEPTSPFSPESGPYLQILEEYLLFHSLYVTMLDCFTG